MRTGLYIALRYLFSKKKRNAVNYITWITVLGFAVGAFALIVILSTLNGFEKLILSMYSRFDPDLRIEPQQGKVFTIDEATLNKIKGLNAVTAIYPVVEDQAVIKHYENQSVCLVKGVPNDYIDKTGLAPYVLDGEPILSVDGEPRAILGAGIDFKLQTRVNNPHSITTLYVPRRGNYSINDPGILNSLAIWPSGVIVLDEQINQRYIFVPIDFARELFERDSAISFLEIRLKDESLMKETKLLISQMLNAEELKIKDRYQQQESLYKMFKSEKWVTYALLTFVLILASFNVTGSLSMLIVEKKKDIFTLKTLGADNLFIRRLFLTEGMLIGLLGGVIGLTIGCLLVLAQKEFGLIKMQGAIVESFPVILMWTDVILIFGTTLVLGWITSLYPAYNSTKKQ
jgi:lipoprotein-releasing system permease protein